MDPGDYTVSTPSETILEIRPKETVLSELESEKRKLLDRILYRAMVSDTAIFDISNIELTGKQNTDLGYSVILDIQMPGGIKPNTNVIADDIDVDQLSPSPPWLFSREELDTLELNLPESFKIEYDTEVTDEGIDQLATQLELTHFETEVIRAMLTAAVEKISASQGYEFDDEMATGVANVIGKMLATEYNMAKEEGQ